MEVAGAAAGECLRIASYAECGASASLKLLMLMLTRWSRYYTNTEVKSKSNFESLPNEVLQLVWAHLEDPASWAQICTRFEQLSRDTLWRSRWFMQRYAPYLVIYEAIARPKLFTPSLLEHLIRLGAPISRNLVQLLYLMHNPLSTYISNRERFKWGKVTSTAYVAIMQHAIALVSVRRKSLLTASHAARTAFGLSSQVVSKHNSKPQYGEKLELKELDLFDSSVFSGRCSRRVLHSELTPDAFHAIIKSLD